MTYQVPQFALEISPRFRRSLEERIARLDRDADFDEAQLARLTDPDHIRRQVLLVASQRAEALKMRLFLDRCVHAETPAASHDWQPL